MKRDDHSLLDRPLIWHKSIMAGAYRVEDHGTHLDGLAFSAIVDILGGVSNSQGLFRSKARRSSQNAKAIVMKILFHGPPCASEMLPSSCFRRANGLGP